MAYKINTISVRSLSGLFKIIIACTITIWIYFMIFDLLKIENKSIPSIATEEVQDVSPYSKHMKLTREFYAKRKSLSLSNLGKILFLDELEIDPKENTFKILIWKQGKFLERRHLKSFSENLMDPFEHCPVKNCVLSYNDDDLDNADAVIFHLHGISSTSDYPDPKRKRPSNQRWVFLTDESPEFTFYKGYDWKNLNGVFNWSMSYKLESDVPVPYGRSEPMDNYIPAKPGPEDQIMELVPYGNIKRRDVLVAIAVSNCQGDRMKYIEELRKHLDVDIYGSCGSTYQKTCPGNFKQDCPNLRQYLFYLSFENSLCDQYMTEKVFWNAYKNGAIPIILGASKKFCQFYLPPSSYLHVDGYARPADLAKHILMMNQTWNNELFRYQEWRRHYRVLNEHGYFGSRSVHYCRMCEALNYNDDTPTVYDDLSFYLDPEENCKNLY